MPGGTIEIDRTGYSPETAKKKWDQLEKSFDSYKNSFSHMAKDGSDSMPPDPYAYVLVDGKPLSSILGKNWRENNDDASLSAYKEYLKSPKYSEDAKKKVISRLEKDKPYLVEIYVPDNNMRIPSEPSYTHDGYKGGYDDPKGYSMNEEALVNRAKAIANLERMAYFDEYTRLNPLYSQELLFKRSSSSEAYVIYEGIIGEEDIEIIENVKTLTLNKDKDKVNREYAINKKKETIKNDTKQYKENKLENLLKDIKKNEREVEILTLGPERYAVENFIKEHTNSPLTLSGTIPMGLVIAELTVNQKMSFEDAFDPKKEVKKKETALNTIIEKLKKNDTDYIKKICSSFQKATQEETKKAFDGIDFSDMSQVFSGNHHIISHANRLLGEMSPLYNELGLKIDKSPAQKARLAQFKYLDEAFRNGKRYAHCAVGNTAYEGEKGNDIDVTDSILSDYMNIKLLSDPNKMEKIIKSTNEIPDAKKALEDSNAPKTVKNLKVQCSSLCSEDYDYALVKAILNGKVDEVVKPNVGFSNDGIFECLFDSRNQKDREDVILYNDDLSKASKLSAFLSSQGLQALGTNTSPHASVFFISPNPTVKKGMIDLVKEVEKGNLYVLKSGEQNACRVMFTGEAYLPEIMKDKQFGSSFTKRYLDKREYREPPEEPNWFVRQLNRFFGWFPDRIKEYKEYQEMQSLDNKLTEIKNSPSVQAQNSQVRDANEIQEEQLQNQVQANLEQNNPKNQGPEQEVQNYLEQVNSKSNSNDIILTNEEKEMKKKVDNEFASLFKKLPDKMKNDAEYMINKYDFVLVNGKPLSTFISAIEKAIKPDLSVKEYEETHKKESTEAAYLKALVNSVKARRDIKVYGLDENFNLKKPLVLSTTNTAKNDNKMEPLKLSSTNTAINDNKKNNKEYYKKHKKLDLLETESVKVVDNSIIALETKNLEILESLAICEKNLKDSLENIINNTKDIANKKGAVKNCRSYLGNEIYREEMFAGVDAAIENEKKNIQNNQRVR